MQGENNYKFDDTAGYPPQQQQGSGGAPPQQNYAQSPSPSYVSAPIAGYVVYDQRPVCGPISWILGIVLFFLVGPFALFVLLCPCDRPQGYYGGPFPPQGPAIAHPIPAQPAAAPRPYNPALAPRN